MGFITEKTLKIAINLILFCIVLQCVLFLYSHNAGARALSRYSTEIVIAGIVLDLMFKISVLLGFCGVLRLLSILHTGSAVKPTGRDHSVLKMRSVSHATGNTGFAKAVKYLLLPLMFGCFLLILKLGYL